MNDLFKAYDIRGVYPTQLTVDFAYNFGRALVSFLKCNNVVVGRDMRLSSDALFKAVRDGINDQGAEVIDIGLSTTPMMYFTVARFGYEAGINITASHNPKEYNGFKVVRKDAVPISGESGLFEIKRIMEKGSFGMPKEKGTVTKRHDIVEAYVRNALSFAEAAKIGSFKVVIDTANAMGGIVMPELFGRLQCRIVHMYPELDGSFPNHEANPLKEENLEDLKKRVVKEGADLGIALDGDADRIMFIDEKGELVRPDLVTAVLARSVLERHPGAKILYDLRSSWAVREEIEKLGGVAVQCRVGHSLIKEQMRKENALFGGELSGHY